MEVLALRRGAKAAHVKRIRACGTCLTLCDQEGTLVADPLSMSTVVATAVIIFFLAMVVVYIWPHPERFDKILVATFGAFIGSLLGRVLADPSWPLHLVFVAGGAFAFSCLDWTKRLYSASSRSTPRLDDRHRH